MTKPAEPRAAYIPLPRFPWRHAENLDWMEQARCVELGIDPEQFFPRKPKGGNHQSEARRIINIACSRCPVAEQCFQYGKDIRAPHGVWGGVEFGTRNRGASYGD